MHHNLDGDTQCLTRRVLFFLQGQWCAREEEDGRRDLP